EDYEDDRRRRDQYADEPRSRRRDEEDYDDRRSRRRRDEEDDYDDRRSRRRRDEEDDYDDRGGMKASEKAGWQAAATWINLVAISGWIYVGFAVFCILAIALVFLGAVGVASTVAGGNPVGGIRGFWALGGLMVVLGILGALLLFASGVLELVGL